MYTTMGRRGRISPPCSENRTKPTFFPENGWAAGKYISMRHESKHAVVQRLTFAVAELDVVGEIANPEEDAVLLEQLHTLTERVRDCIRFVSNDSNKRPSLPEPNAPSFSGDLEVAT